MNRDFFRKFLPIVFLVTLYGCQKDSAEKSLPDAEKKPSRLVLYSVLENENYAIYVMDENNKSRQLLKDSLSMSPHPLWSPDGSKILYFSESNLYLINPSGSDNHPLTQDNKVEYITYDWSPDGKKIVYSGEQKIYLMNADGTGQRVLTSAAGNLYNTLWSPDGLKILYVLARDNSTQIYTIDTNGQNRMALTRTGKDDRPCWSPDGKKILFTSRRDGATQIYSMLSDGSHQKRLTFTESTEIYQMWSPLGDKIAFVSFRDELVGGKIYLMDEDGKHQEQLTFNPGVDYPKDWSPDGSKILYVSRQRGNSEVFSVEVASSQVTRLTDTPALEEDAQWSPVIF